MDSHYSVAVLLSLYPPDDQPWLLQEITMSYNDVSNFFLEQLIVKAY